MRSERILSVGCSFLVVWILSCVTLQWRFCPGAVCEHWEWTIHETFYGTHKHHSPIYKILLSNAVLCVFKGWGWCQSIFLRPKPTMCVSVLACLWLSAWFQTFESLPTSLSISVIQRWGLVLCSLVADSTIWKTSRANQGFVGRIKNGDVMFLYQRQKNDWRQGHENGGKRGRDGCSFTGCCEWT